jgi:hypothetical protein
MPPIVVSVDIDRSQEEVFAYAIDPSRFAEWQSGVVGGSMEGAGKPEIGAKCITTRRIGRAERGYFGAHRE